MWLCVISTRFSFNGLQDEIDALAVSRAGSESTSSHEGVLTSLLNEMDGMQELAGVTVVAATNRPDVLVKILSADSLRLNAERYAGLRFDASWTFGSHLIRRTARPTRSGRHITDQDEQDVN